MERVEPILHFIANIAQRIDPNIEPWASIRNQLPARSTPSLIDLPHWSRFVLQTGVTARGPGEIRWLFRSQASMNTRNEVQPSVTAISKTLLNLGGNHVSSE